MSCQSLEAFSRCVWPVEPLEQGALWGSLSLTWKSERSFVMENSLFKILYLELIFEISLEMEEKCIIKKFGQKNIFLEVFPFFFE